MRNYVYRIVDTAIKDAEIIYDSTIRRWGNTKYAQACVYNYVWSKGFKVLCKKLSEDQKGEIRLAIMDTFSAKIWSEK